ncbi:MAG: hypothetical protein E8D52_01510 [Nitrospira sp.]|nr:MAG: hypothetical protein E8D52_01510 [Nitrospira sp.]
MSQVDPSEELFTAGIESYPGVMQAVSEFRRLVTESARRIMLRHMEEFRAVLNREDLHESEFKDLNDMNDSRIQVGVVVGYPETWGIMWGLRWDIAETTSEPKVFLGVRFGGYKRRDSFFRKFSSNY